MRLAPHAISLAAHLLTAHPTPARPYGPAHEQTNSIAIMCYARSSQESFRKSIAKIKSCWLLGNRTRSSHLPVVGRREANKAFSDMTIALPLRVLISSPIVQASRNRRSTSGTGLLQVLRNPSEWKCAATVALVFFIASLALAPALTRDQKKLALEINAKTLKAAAAIKISPRLTRRVKH